MGSSDTTQFRLRYPGPARHVRLITFMPRFPSPIDFVEERGEWVLENELPSDARIEYRIEVDDGHVASILDPHNSATSANPFGVNSVWTGPDYRLPDWTSAPAERGATTEIRVQSRHLSGRRHHVLYAPPGLASQTPAPLLVVHDGSDYIRFAGLLRCVESLIEGGRIRPVRVVGLNPRVRHERYIASDDHADHVIEEVLPHVGARVALDGRMAVMGASLGAVAAWHTAWRHPGVFSGLVIQSGTFALHPHPELDDAMFGSINRFVRAALDDPRLDRVDVLQSCGRWESLVEWNRTVSAVLTRRAARHRYVETWTGHDWGAWSGTMADGLEMVFGA